MALCLLRIHKFIWEKAKIENEVIILIEIVQNIHSWYNKCRKS